MSGGMGAKVDSAAISVMLGALFETHRALNHAPRLAWGVVHDGELAFSGGAAADAHTVFRIASMTKSFTAAAVLSLRDEGAFGLDDPIVSHAPELAPIVTPSLDSPQVTIRHLLTMNSGLATDDPWADRHMDMADDELDDELRAGALFAVPPGTAMQYSNLGYGLLGRVVYRTTGQRLQQYISQRFLAPLGMHDTAWTADSYGSEVDLAVGQARIDNEFVALAMVGDGAIAPMGGIFTTVADLAIWVQFLASAFPARDDADVGPLRRSSRREMQQVATVFPPDTRTALDGQRRQAIGGYGMGLMALHDDRAGTVVTHSGGLPGYGSNMRWIRGTRTGVIALANVTYARMADASAAALDLLIAQDVAERPTVVVGAEVQRCAEELVRLINNWTSSAADLLFSDNVGMDASMDRRCAAAHECVAQHGALRLLSIDAVSAAEADVLVRGTTSEATLRIEFQLSSQLPPKIQWYEICDV